MMMTARESQGPGFWFRWLVAGILCLGLGSCGYTYGVRLPEEAKSIGVAVFDNTSLFPKVEGEVFACVALGFELLYGDFHCQ